MSSWIEILKILIRNEIRTYLDKSNRIFHLKVNEKFFLVFKFIETLIITVLTVVLMKFYHFDKYINEVKIIYIMLLFIFITVICFGVKKKIFLPINIEIYQLSMIKKKNIYKIIFLKEIIWNFIKYIDALIPIITIGKIILGLESGIIIDLFAISTSLLVCFCGFMIRNIPKNKRNKIDIKYFFVVPIISIISKKIINGILEISYILRNKLDINDDKKIEEVESLLKKYFFHHGEEIKEIIKKTSKIIFCNQKIILGISGMSIFLLIIILKKWYINYSKKDISSLKKSNNMLKDKYLKLLEKIFKKDKTYFMLKKDINIIRNNNTYINKNILQTIFLPYELFIISIMFYTICNNIENKYIFINLIITYLITMMMTIFSNIKINLDDLLTFKTDAINWDLFKCSEYTSKSVFNAKLKLFRTMALIPSTIIIFMSILFTNIKEIVWYDKIGFIGLLIIIWKIMLYILPMMEIYIYPVFIEKFGDKYIGMFEEEEMDISKKFIMLPKNMISRPIIFIFVISSIIRIFDNNMWRIITIVNVLWIGICVILCKKMVSRNKIK